MMHVYVVFVVYVIYVVVVIVLVIVLAIWLVLLFMFLFLLLLKTTKPFCGVILLLCHPLLQLLCALNHPWARILSVHHSQLSTACHKAPHGQS